MPRARSSFAVILDACVLYPAPLRDLLVELAQAGLYRALWTASIHEEWMSAVRRDRPDIPVEALERTRQLMDAHADHCLVTGYEGIIGRLALPDPGDRHVLAAAIVGRVEAIVTFNKTDFPDEVLGSFGMEAIHPDDFLSGQIDLDRAPVVTAVRRVRARLRNPPRTAREYLDALVKQRLPATVSLLEQDIDSI